MVDIIGPASAKGAVTFRPPEDRSFSSLDTFFKDCTSATAQDGTVFAAAFFNGLLQLLRAVVRSNGTLLDGTTKVITEDGRDDLLLLKAIQQLVQRGQQTFAEDTGDANALVATFSPAVLELKEGLTIRVKAAHSVTGAATINVNGLGNVAIKKTNGAGLAADDIKGGGIAILTFDGTYFQLIATHQDLIGEDGSPTNFVIPLADAAGSATVITVDYDPDVALPTKGQLISVRLTADIAGATTINPDAHGAKAVVDTTGAALIAGFAVNGELLVLEYDGTKYRVINKSPPSQSWVAYPGVGSYYVDFLFGNPYEAPGAIVAIYGKAGTWKVIQHQQQGVPGSPDFSVYFTMNLTFYQRIA